MSKFTNTIISNIPALYTKVSHCIKKYLKFDSNHQYTVLDLHLLLCVPSHLLGYQHFSQT